MAVYKGSDKIEDIYVGGNKIKKIYKGSELVYDGTEIIPFDEFYINASGAVFSAYFLTGLIPLDITTRFKLVLLSSGMNTFALPVTANTFTGSLTQLNTGQTLYVYKGTAGAYQLVGSILLAKGATYNLTF